MPPFAAPPIRDLFRLGTSTKHTNKPPKVQAWTNPAFEPSAPGTGGRQPGDTALDMATGSDDLIEAMFPASGRKLFRRMTWQFWAVVLLVVADAFVIAWTDPIYTDAPFTQVIVYSVQVGLLLAIAMAFFVLTSQTLYISLGRYDLYLREFAAFYASFALVLAIYIALRVYTAVLLYRRISYLALWDAPAYTPLWAVYRVLLVLFWIATCSSALSVFDAKYFDPEYLVSLHAARREGRGREGRRVAKAEQQAREKAAAAAQQAAARTAAAAAAAGVGPGGPAVGVPVVR